jgi:GntR family histidine utilization transcriptional repressor
VAEPKGQSALFEMRSIADEIAARHHQHRCEVLVLEETQASAEQATALNVKEGSRIFHFVMVHFENEVPVQIEDRCVNAEWCRTICIRITPRPRRMIICR